MIYDPATAPLSGRVRSSAPRVLIEVLDIGSSSLRLARLDGSDLRILAVPLPFPVGLTRNPDLQRGGLVLLVNHLRHTVQVITADKGIRHALGGAEREESADSECICIYRADTGGRSQNQYASLAGLLLKRLPEQGPYKLYSSNHALRDKAGYLDEGRVRGGEVLTILSAIGSRLVSNTVSLPEIIVSRPSAVWTDAAEAYPGAELLFLDKPGVRARAVWKNGALTVLAGSSGLVLDARRAQQGLDRMRTDRLRDQLADEGVLWIGDRDILFLRDHTFDSPSTAAEVLLHRKLARSWEHYDGSFFSGAAQGLQVTPARKTPPKPAGKSPYGYRAAPVAAPAGAKRSATTPPPRSASEFDGTRITLAKAGTDIKAEIRGTRIRILKGSIGLLASDTPSNRKIRRDQLQLVTSGSLSASGERCTFLRDLEFSSPSAAGAMCLGRQMSAWDDWRLAESGAKLRSLKSQIRFR